MRRSGDDDRKGAGKNRIVHFGEGNHERPDAAVTAGRDGRSIAHLNLLQSLSGKLNRLNDVREIGLTIANELRSLIDYHNCRVFVVEGETIVPIAFRGELTAPSSPSIDVLRVTIGEGITGHVVATGRPSSPATPPNANSPRRFRERIVIDESLLAVPMHFGTRAIGAIVISKLGFDQFDGDDLRLLEVLAGQASVALENARLYEVQRLEAETARTLLEFARELATAQGVEGGALPRTVDQAAHILGAERTSIWVEDAPGGRLVPRALHGCGDVGPVDSTALARELPARLGGNEEPFVVEAGDGAYAVAPLLFDDGKRALPRRPRRSIRGRRGRASAADARRPRAADEARRRERPELRRSRRDVQCDSPVADERCPRSRPGSEPRPRASVGPRTPPSRR